MVCNRGVVRGDSSRHEMKREVIKTSPAIDGRFVRKRIKIFKMLFS